MTPTSKFLSVSLAFLVGVNAPIVARSQSNPAPAARTIPVPAVADIMAQTQFRHMKLGYAGEVGNWPLAGYEAEQMKGSFNDAAGLGTSVGSVPLSQLIQEKSLPPLQDLEKAIAAKSEKEFLKAYKELTEACNACHVAANVGFIKIRAPTASPFSNQAFPP